MTATIPTVMRSIDRYSSFGVGRITLVELVCENSGDQLAKVEISGSLEFQVSVLMFDPSLTTEAIVTAVTSRLEGYESVADAFDDLGEPEVNIEIELGGNGPGQASDWYGETGES